MFKLSYKVQLWSTLPLSGLSVVSNCLLPRQYCAGLEQLKSPLKTAHALIRTKASFLHWQKYHIT